METHANPAVWSQTATGSVDAAGNLPLPVAPVAAVQGGEQRRVDDAQLRARLLKMIVTSNEQSRKGPAGDARSGR